MAEKLNRPPVMLRGLQRSFKLPVCRGAGYSESYLAFLDTVLALRTLNVTEKTLLKLWRIERKLMRMLHADTTGSPTWFLDSCGSARNRKRRLLLSHFDIGATLPSGGIQLGLAFAEPQRELFTSREMGEDVLTVLNLYAGLHDEIRDSVRAEMPRLFSALSLTKRFDG
jgi:hypothetical protein